MIATLLERNDAATNDTRSGTALFNDPIRNKGTAFTKDERRKYGIEGLLPQAVETLDRQLERVIGQLDAKSTDLERYIYLVSLADRNETLFFRTLMSDPARFLPIVYDPTVADACLAFGHIYRRARGMYIDRSMKGRMAEVLRNWPSGLFAFQPAAAFSASEILARTAWVSRSENLSSTPLAQRSRPTVCCP
jgi:hypothetical protein